MLDEELKQPTIDIQAHLNDLMNAEPTEFEWRGKKRKMGWMRYAVQRKFTSIMFSDKGENAWRRNVKLCAVILLNSKSGFWSMIKETFFYPIYWRWLYYVVSIDQIDVLRVLDESKKKIQLEPCLMCTMLATEMTDTMMTMSSQEVKAIQAEQD